MVLVIDINNSKNADQPQSLPASKAIRWCSKQGTLDTLDICAHRNHPAHK